MKFGHPQNLLLQYLKPKNTYLLPLLYTLLSEPLTSIQEDWVSQSFPVLRAPRPISRYQGYYAYNYGIPPRVKEIVTRPCHIIPFYENELDRLLEENPLLVSQPQRLAAIQDETL